ncbi:MAG: SRPBCC family protein [Verrucomicrobia bacterium]|nr:SRPBCC family protein [Verrucomicrobiota bacterium]
MKSFLKKLLLAFVVIVAAFVVVVALQPAAFRVERAATIAAAPAEVFSQVNDFHKWEAWSPWAKLDPAAKNSFEGPASGTGAIFKWSGNHEVGKGSMTILESRPRELIRIRLDFIKPFKDTSTVEFTFKPEGSQTVVTWLMFGENNFISKAMCLFISIDKMVGGQFEKGLASIKSIVETAATSKPE